MIRVLIADDSPTVRALLVHLIESQPDMDVIAQAKNGAEALEMCVKFKPDIVTMDVSMPVQDGISAIRKIMATCPCPIIIVSEFWNGFKKEHTAQAFEVGALGVVNKPRGPGHPEYERDGQRLLKSLRLLSEIKVVTRKTIHRGPSQPAKKSSVNHESTAVKKMPAVSSLVLIGASTGGPVVIKEILEQIPKPYPLPILIVQHISLACLDGLMDWLSKSTGHDVCAPRQGEIPEPGKVYFAPDNFQMGISKTGSIQLRDDPKENGLKPSVSYLFRSGVGYHPEKTIAILLTGMGADGSEELLDLKKAGATTLIQEEKSCVVFGMPGEAFKKGAHTYMMTPAQIGIFLASFSTPQTLKSLTPDPS